MLCLFATKTENPVLLCAAHRLCTHFLHLADVKKAVIHGIRVYGLLYQRIAKNYAQIWGYFKQFHLAVSFLVFVYFT